MTSLLEQESLSPEKVKAWRQARRRELLGARTALAPEERARKSEQAVSRFLRAWDDGSRPALAGRIVGGYFPFRGEVDVLPLLHELLRRDAFVALPVVPGPAQPLQFRRWKPGDAMSRGVYDIPYPACEDRVEPDIMLVPLLGFDPACCRLGYGGGYYDRTLAAAAKRPFTIGIGYELGRLPSIHPQPYDVALDCIVTEGGFFGRDSA